MAPNSPACWSTRCPNRAGLAPADKVYLEALRAAEVGALLDEVITFRLRFSRRARALEYRS